MLYFYSLTFFVCFFFQAEDGIRDADVTGVQTCALPISAGHGMVEGPGVAAAKVGDQAQADAVPRGEHHLDAEIAGGLEAHARSKGRERSTSAGDRRRGGLLNEFALLVWCGTVTVASSAHHC